MISGQATSGVDDDAPLPRAARPGLSCCRRLTQLTTPLALTHSVNQTQQHIEWGMAMGENPHSQREKSPCERRAVQSK